MIETPTVSETPLTEHLLRERLLSDLTTDPNNARLHSDANLDTITHAIQEVGTARSIVIDEDGVILAGNATAQAAQKAGVTKVQIVDADGDTLIAVRRTGLTPEAKARLALFDNRASDLSEFDPLTLAGLQAEGISLEGLWTGDELDAMLADLPEMDSLTADSMTADEVLTPSVRESPSFHVPAASIRSHEIRSDQEMDEERQQRRESTQASEVSPRPPSADTDPYKPPPSPVAGLDRVTPDQDTSRAGLFLHFRALKIPLSAEEGALLDVRLAAYREEAGTFYGFIHSIFTGKGLGDEE